MTPTTARPRNTAEDKVPITATPNAIYRITDIELALSSLEGCWRHSPTGPHAIASAARQNSNPHYTFPCRRNVRRTMPSHHGVLGRFQVKSIDRGQDSSALRARVRSPRNPLGTPTAQGNRDPHG